MSITHIKTALKLISEHVELADFENHKSEKLIKKAEQVLGIKYPPSYRMFLKQLGCGSIAGQEFYGLVDENFNKSGIPDGVWLTLNERISSNLPENLIIISSAGDGMDFVLDSDQPNSNNEYPVVAWIPGLSKMDDKLEVVAPDFGEFFLETISDAIENWDYNED